jgi:hypothetical protein
MDITERTIFQPPFSLKRGVGKRIFIIVKKVIIVSSVNHYDVVGKPS